ncbi:UDP-N-acetylglucosamine 1-carboxyvinyltransferase [Aquisalimonas asiatica]|uniref:UDP-N-acetylglucosamine 1-carboxyvinyltransferase n=1 Tax=Aquisalimonas asiatica TaxID=406100 RepID=A0A1H8SNC0_9GAMM|nr:UDP-N-acetylglucosamine 1-carboxyvinyltransferase [Aquisalimonas asiatica]SEO80469.1 UDP-N-acetylglucosamine 1-carboxyvinyltransferase [Aquisalimonas asiatica]
MELRISGPQRLNGSVTVSGAKNSATRVLAAALVTNGRVTLRNFPLALEDAKAKMSFLSGLGVEFEQRQDRSELMVTVPDLSLEDIQSFDLPIRTTYLLAAGMLARCGYARIPYPGGCKIGSRGYDLHMMVWRELGCEVEEKPDYIEIRGRLVGGQVDFPMSTVGGTENALICAAVARGETLIRNAYVTPEVRDLVAFLREMGARVKLEGTSLIRVEGDGALLGDASFSIMPDRIEALTWIILGAVTEGTVFVNNVPFDTMEVSLLHLRDAGVDLFANSDTVMVSPDCIGEHGVQPFELATGTHPGVISDMQSFFAFLGLFANGRSVVFDYRYPERIAYAHELAKFAPGAIEAEPGRITVHGPRRLSAAQVASTDLRGSMAQIMAAICAEGESRVHGVELALRGYNELPKKLAALGAEVVWRA